MNNYKYLGKKYWRGVQEQWFLWEKEAPDGVDFNMFNFQALLEAQEVI